MCRAQRVLCAALDAARLDELRRAAVGAEWELVPGATGMEELAARLKEDPPADIVVLDAAMGAEAVALARGGSRGVRVIAVGPDSMVGADATAASLKELRGAIQDLPTPGGPVRPVR